MKSKLYHAATTADSYTENGAVTHSTTGHSVLDFFFNAPVSRNKSDKDLVAAYAKAYNEDRDLALRALLWSRDILKGAGERRLFRTCLLWLIDKHIDDAYLVMGRSMEDGIGRWDDIFVAMNTEAEEYALQLFVNALLNKDRLAAKWAPRKGEIAHKLRSYMQLSPKDYRRLVVGLSNTVEQQMCANLWDEIEYSHVPSVAHSRYRKAFGRHSKERYVAYLNRVKDPNSSEKINAKAIFPHDVIRPSMLMGYGPGMSSLEIQAAETQWYALPDYVDGDESILPVIDVSGSMTSRVGPTTLVNCLDVAVTLGLYVSERLKSAFKDHFVTFSTTPKLQYVTGSVVDRMQTICRSKWDMSTNLIGVFELILQTAKKHRLSQEDLPTKVLILSDMEFDSAVRGGTNFDTIDKMYQAAGFTRPQLVFWNIQSRSDSNFPVKQGTAGTALISGFSPAILSSVMSGELEPLKVVAKTLRSPRYDY